MKKIIYTLAVCTMGGLSVQAQTPIKETREELMDVALINDSLLIYTKKEKEGQFLYTELQDAPGSAQKAAPLNAGTVNMLVGHNPATGEVYVYQRRGRRDEVIAFYAYSGGGFTKTGEKQLPRLRNNSRNLGLFLTPDKNTLLISAELGRTQGYDDLYRSTWEGGRWSKPRNLGKAVNSRQAEFAPFLTQDSLYFSRKEGDVAYVYAVPLQDGLPAEAVPARLSGKVNREGAFNAYYKRQGTRELWFTAEATGARTAYVSGAEAATAPAPAAAEEARPAPLAEGQPTPMPLPAAVARPADLQLPYRFNSLYLDKAAAKELHAFLQRQPQGARLHVTGFSDARGTEEARREVSRKRAAFVAWYAQRMLPGKHFAISTDHQVVEEEGAAYRKVEIRLGE
ncbi:OmpA family protein [Pontibacter mangrovi]|uniref:OmpA-like domain-containing protein n=1 Tax=Pontibacter mangrovi TaxID=2589816 RepID=A0A501W2T6_9BACT|nr:OmpA family protein [Pontibacter mangrovi]TPE42394.1 hypothetical protein FJM65_18385 [Pontibacter mangrovi]